MIRIAVLAVALTVIPAAADEPPPTCIAAAERMMAFTLKEYESNPDIELSAQAKSPEAQEAFVAKMAEQMSADGVETCNHILAMPDNEMRDLAHAQVKQ